MEIYKRRVKRNEFGCLNYRDEPIEKILKALRFGKVTSIELTNKMIIETYAKVFESIDTSKIKELSLSGPICDAVDDTTYICLNYIFAQVQHLESLVCSYSTNIIKLMKHLRTLRSLTLRYVKYDSEIEQYFVSQNSIKKLELTIESQSDAIKLLTIVSGNHSLRDNLTELSLHMDFDADTIEIIKTFRNLQVLRMVMGGEVSPIDFNGLPIHLRDIKIGGLKISCTQFFSLIDELESLEVFDVGRGDIYLDTDNDTGLGDSRVSTFIARKLLNDHPKRTVKIVRIKPPMRMDY